MKMKRVLLAATMLVVGAAANAADTLRVDLNKALEVALSDNPTIKIADKEIQRVDYSKRGAWYGMVPTLTVSGQVGHYLAPAKMSMLGNVIDSPTDFTASATISLSLPIIAPSLWMSINMTDIDVKLAAENARASKISLTNEVKKAFYSIMLAQDSHQAIKEGYDLAKQNYEEAKRKFEVGTAAEYDLVSSEVEMRNIVPQMLQVENAVKQTKLMLKVLMGLDTNVELVVDGKLSDFEGELKSVADGSISLENNPDLIKIELQQKQIDKTVWMQRSMNLPTLVGFGQYGYSGTGNKETDLNFGGMPMHVDASKEWYGQGLIIGLQLNWTIFGGLTNINKVKQLKVQSLTLNEQKDYLQSNLNMQVVASLDNMKKAVEQVESNKEGVRLAQKGYDISQKRYETGMGTMLELRSSQLALTQSKLSYSQSISDYLSAKSEYEKILGL